MISFAKVIQLVESENLDGFLEYIDNQRSFLYYKNIECDDILASKVGIEKINEIMNFAQEKSDDFLSAIQSATESINEKYGSDEEADTHYKAYVYMMMGLYMELAVVTMIEIQKSDVVMGNFIDQLSKAMRIEKGKKTKKLKNAKRDAEIMRIAEDKKSINKSLNNHSVSYIIYDQWDDSDLAEYGALKPRRIREILDRQCKIPPLKQ